VKEEVNEPTSNARAGGHVVGGGISWGRKSIRGPYETSGSVKEGGRSGKMYVAKVAVGTWNSVECRGRSCTCVADGVVWAGGK
jgi:hypothetical protein